MAFLDRRKFPGLAATVYLTLVALCLHGALTAPYFGPEGAFDYELAIIMLTAPLLPLLVSLLNTSGPVSASVLVIICAAVNAYLIYRVCKSIAGLD